MVGDELTGHRRRRRGRWFVQLLTFGTLLWLTESGDHTVLMMFGYALAGAAVAILALFWSNRDHEDQAARDRERIKALCQRLAAAEAVAGRLGQGR